MALKSFWPRATTPAVPSIATILLLAPSIGMAAPHGTITNAAPAAMVRSSPSRPTEVASFTTITLLRLPISEFPPACSRSASPFIPQPMWSSSRWPDIRTSTLTAPRPDSFGTGTGSAAGGGSSVSATFTLNANTTVTWKWVPFVLSGSLQNHGEAQQYTLSWPSVGGKVYDILCATNVSGSFAPVATGLAATPF